MECINILLECRRVPPVSGKSTNQHVKWAVGIFVAWQIMNFVVSTLVLYLFLLIKICHAACFSRISSRDESSSWHRVFEGEYEAMMEIAAFGAAPAWGTHCQFWEFWNLHKMVLLEPNSPSEETSPCWWMTFLLRVSESEFHSFSI